MNKTIPYTLICTLLVVCSCTSRPDNARNAGELPMIYPDYIGVTIPAGIAPMNFNVTNPGVDRVYVAVAGDNGGNMESAGGWACFDPDEWQNLTRTNTGAGLTFTVYGRKDGQWLRYDDFRMEVSADTLADYGLTYRRIAPGYEVYSDMGIYQRDLSTYDEYAIIENTQTSGQCYNCHTANRTDPSSYVMHVRGSHGATLLSRDGECTWLRSQNDSIGGSLVYPYWHPSGRYCAFSTNQTRQGFHIAGAKRLEVFDLSSDVLVYDVERNEIITDTLLSTKAWSENTPVFTPDGRSLYFTTCLQKEYPLEHKLEQYNLCRVDFDPETGRPGEKVDTIFDAVALGKSVSWPRPSYDGRFMLFTISDYGYFSIWHKESEQWIMDLATGEAQPLEAANSDDADSYHNWSADSRWVVFTSRRDDGLYSRLYICHIDADGNASKPFLLPQRNPEEYYGRSLYSYNTPDFTSQKVDLDAKTAVKEILGDNRVNTQIR